MIEKKSELEFRMEKVSGRAERQDRDAVLVDEALAWLRLLDTSAAVQPVEAVETEMIVERCVTVTVWGLLPSTAVKREPSNARAVGNVRILGENECCGSARKSDVQVSMEPKNGPAQTRERKRMQNGCLEQLFGHAYDCFSPDFQ